MLAEEVESAPVSASEHRASFFRQSGWLMFATVSGGVCMTAVHLLSHGMPKGDYGQFVAFLSVAMFIPAMPLQMVLAQQTARSLALHREHELSGLIRGPGSERSSFGLSRLRWCCVSSARLWRSGPLTTPSQSG